MRTHSIKNKYVAMMLTVHRNEALVICSNDDVTYVYDDVTYVYDDVTYVYDDNSAQK